MPDLAWNPHLAICLDFTSKSYHLARDHLVNETIDHNAAECQLELLWTVNNDLERQEWDQQLEEQQAATEKEILAREEQEQLQQEQERECKLALQEDKKKYCHKHAPIPQDAMIPTEPIIIPVPIATHKLCKGDYCKLYFFTNKGLKDAELTP
ncbi:hypothetical protein BKA82DRAFT_29900 [Pisolithus tinctorius]|uniref:Uncharacterized protein n=1 Tax=Pisolithus tinctorius Marx 270 TaxID=870435 RepID=A0A0C3NGC1_PISTI|nr:hypothetical protein BKA82DRAFT_29900 [Pisolithus tinctorius]KIO00080.1 hypothetical protein M404DRAFT_29900 [Pisolithus tinctorius Marx 270]